MTPTTDALLDGRYRLSELIARGGMGEVWAAQDLVLQRTVAVKVLRTAFIDNQTFQARFRAEARNAARLNYPGIAQVFDYGEGPGLAYLVMELVPGESLSALLKRVGRLPVERALAFVAQAAAALQQAHDAGVVHRDVKPGNLLVTPDDRVKITDFGIARATDDATRLTAAGQVVGTAYYLSPEQARGRKVGPASDVYALGVVAYECLAGRRPFDGDNPTMVALAQVRDEPPPLPADVPEPVRALVARMLAKEPASRPGNAGEVALVAAALRSACADNAHEPQRRRTGSPASAPTPPPPPSRESGPSLMAPTETLPAIDAVPPPGRTRLLVVAVLVAAVVLIAIMATAALSSPPRQQTEAPDATAARSTVTTPALMQQQPTSPPARVTASPSALTVEIDPTDFIGQRFFTVRQKLVTLGFGVRREDSDARGVPGTVSGIAPDGPIEVGTIIEVSVIERRSPRENGPGRKEGQLDDHD
jgi:eukaryotic-like serine/threonine-protein kinase